MRTIAGDADVLVLNQAISLVRYAGPYVACNSARKAGYRVKILEHFTVAEDIFDSVKAFCGPRTRYVVITTTFLYSYSSVSHGDQYLNGAKFSSWLRFKTANLNLWLDSEEAMREWLEGLRACLPAGTKICLAGERVNKLYQYYDYIPDDHPIKACVDLYFLGRDDDLLLNVLQGRSEGFEIRKRKFLVGHQSAAFKDRPIPTEVFGDEDDIGENEVLPIEISRGCAFNCAYCNYDKKTSNKLAEDRLRAQFEHYYDKFGCRTYYFTTDCFNDNIEFVRLFHRVATGLPFRIAWASYARPDLCVRYPETIDLMLESGAASNFYGIETMNREVGKRIGRGLPFDRALGVLEQLKRRSPTYWIKAFFMIGLPGETRESVLQTIEWLKSQTTVDSISAAVLDVEPYADDLKAMFDYASISTDPKRYGFSELRFMPDYYWRHDTMDLHEAQELGVQWVNATKSNPHMARVHSLAYSELQLLGIGPDQARDYMKPQRGKIRDLSAEYLQGYFDRLGTGARVSPIDGRDYWAWRM